MSVMKHALTKLSFEDGRRIAVLTLNNPQRRNALSNQMLAEVADHFNHVREAHKNGTHVMILRASGPVFCSGHDLKELHTSSAAENAKTFERCSGLMQEMQKLPQIVLAEVAGLATAAGCQLVATSDMAVAGASAAFATPGVRIGLFCTTPGVALARRVSSRVALEMLLTGESISAQRAVEIGLINRVVPDEKLEAEIMALARKLCASSGEVLALGKAAFYRQIQHPLDESYNYANCVMTDNLSKVADAHEGLQAFLQKRTPTWKHK